jgi:hypothetical protein
MSFIVMKFRNPKNFKTKPGSYKSVNGRKETIYIVLIHPQSFLSPPPRKILRNKVIAIALPAAV